MSDLDISYVVDDQRSYVDMLTPQTLVASVKISAEILLS